MNQPTVLLVCPACGRTCRTGQETRPGAKMRCPGCDGLFRYFVHGNGAVELRPVEDRPSDERPADWLGDEDPLLAGARLPRRSADAEETKSTRTIFNSRRRNRPIGGYMPFEKSRSYIGTFAFWILVGLGSIAGYWYINQMDKLGNAPGRKGGGGGFNADMDLRRKEFQQRQRKALEKLKKGDQQAADANARQAAPAPAPAAVEKNQPPAE